jgi:hypothetical protein
MVSAATPKQETNGFPNGHPFSRHLCYPDFIGEMIRCHHPPYQDKILRHHPPAHPVRRGDAMPSPAVSIPERLRHHPPALFVGVMLCHHPPYQDKIPRHHPPAHPVRRADAMPSPAVSIPERLRHHQLTAPLITRTNHMQIINHLLTNKVVSSLSNLSKLSNLLPHPSSCAESDLSNLSDLSDLSDFLHH